MSRPTVVAHPLPRIGEDELAALRKALAQYGSKSRLVNRNYQLDETVGTGTTHGVYADPDSLRHSFAALTMRCKGIPCVPVQDLIGGLTRGDLPARGAPQLPLVRKMVRLEGFKRSFPRWRRRGEALEELIKAAGGRVTTDELHGSNWYVGEALFVVMHELPQGAAGGVAPSKLRHGLTTLPITYQQFGRLVAEALDADEAQSATTSSSATGGDDADDDDCADDDGDDGAGGAAGDSDGEGEARESDAESAPASTQPFDFEFH